MITRLVAIAVLLAATLAGQPTAKQTARINGLEHQLVSPCCWQEDVYTHRSNIAQQMKGEIEAMVLAGKSDREIIDHYKALYGMRILVEPEGDLWWVMNVVPAVFLVLAIIAAVLILRRWLRPLPPEASEQHS